MPRRLFAFAGVLLTLLAFGAADVYILTRVLCDKAFVEAELRRVVGRDCTFHKMKPVPFRGITVSRLRLESALMPPGIHVFFVDRLDVAFDPARLLAGEIVPTTIVLESPQLNLLPNRLGEYELLKLLETVSPPARPLGAEPASPPTCIVRKGLLRVQDEAIFRRGHTQVVSDVNVELRPYREGLMLIEGSLLLEGIGRFTITGETDLARNTWTIELASTPNEPIELGPKIAGILADTEEHNLLGAWNNYKPEGPVDLRVRITSDPRQPTEDFVVTMNTRGISATAKAFPYPVEDAKGHFEFRRSGALIHRVKAKSAGTDLSIDGYTNGYDADAGFHLEIEMADLRLDERIKKALHPDDQKTYDLFSPSGVVDVRAEIDREFGDDKPIRNHVWIRCKDARFTYQGLPYPIEKVAGEIELDGPRIEVKAVTGQNGSVVVNGTLVDISGEPDIDVRIEGRKIRLDEKLYRALGEDARKIWKRLSPSGEVNLVWTGRQEKRSGKPLAQRVTIRMSGVDILYDGFPYQLRDLYGEVVYDSAAETVEIRDVDGTHGAAKVRIRGLVRDIGGDGAFDLTVEGTDVELDAELKAALAPENREVWDLFTPSGKVDLVWEGHAVGGRNQDIRQSLWAKLKGCTATYKKIPIRIEGITGQLTYDEGGTRIEHLSGRRGDTSVRIDGTIAPGEDPPFDLTIDVSDLPLSDDVVQALPDRARELLTDWKVRGNLHLKGRFELKDDTGGKRRTLYTTEVRLNEVDLDVGMPLTRLEGRVALSGEVDDERHTARGSADVGRVRVNGKLLTKLHGQFVYEEDRLVFQGLRGDAYEGRIGGEAKFDVPKGTFETNLTISDLDLSTFARDTFVSDKEVAGTLDARASLEGSAMDRSTWTGTLELDIEDGALWEVPLFYRIFSVLSLTDDRKGAFETGMVEGKIRDGKIYVEKMRFESENVKLVGKGWVGFDGELNLQLNSHLKRMGLGPLDPLGALLDPITKNLYAIQAEGTFQEPETSLRPLPFLWGDDEEVDETKPGSEK